MFKKLKDKLAEEVKSSPQRIQQFAQAAQVIKRVLTLNNCRIVEYFKVFFT